MGNSCLFFFFFFFLGRAEGSAWEICILDRSLCVDWGGAAWIAGRELLRRDDEFPMQGIHNERAWGLEK